MLTKRTKRTIRHGAAGGILGACIGIPGIGVLAGVAHANKDKIGGRKNDRSNKYCK